MNFRRTFGYFKPTSSRGASLAGGGVVLSLVCGMFVDFSGVEQLAAREPHKLEVTGASPVPATNINRSASGRLISESGNPSRIGREQSPLGMAGSNFSPQLPETVRTGRDVSPCEKTAENSFLDAMERIESNGMLAALGDHGRSLGPLQISRRAWADCNSHRRCPTSTVKPYASVCDRQTAREYAAEYMRIQAGQFARANHRQPTDAERVAMYQLGFAGFRRRGFNLNNCPASVRAAVAKL